MDGTIVQLKTKDEFTAAGKFQALAALSMYAAVLPPFDFIVLQFVWMRTVFWGKKKEYIPARHFLNGVWNEQEGNWAGGAGGLNISRRTLTDALARLEQAGIIKREMRGNGFPYYEINLDKGEQMLRTPKVKEKKSGPLAQPKNGPKRGVANAARGGSKSRYPHNYENKELENNHTAPAARETEPEKTAKEISEETYAAARAYTAKRRARKAERAHREEHIRGLYQLWADACRAEYPDYVAPEWTPKELRMAKNLRDKLRAEKRGRCADFLIFAVQNWQRIIALHLKWMKKETPPEYPRLSFLVLQQRYFLLAYTDKQFDTRQLTVTQRQREIAKLKKMGLTDAQAEREYEHAQKEQRAVAKAQADAETSDMQRRALLKENKQLRKNELDAKLALGKMVQEQEKSKMNRGSNAPKKKQKLDKDGFAVFQEPELD